MSCPDGKHDLRAINPTIEKDRAGEPVEIVGAPPLTDEEPAWCRNCGALWARRPFDMGWRFMHHRQDRDAPTLINLIREVADEAPSE